MPYVTQTARTYDVGDFEGAMRASLAKADYAGFGARAEAAKKSGLIRGIGISAISNARRGGRARKAPSNSVLTAISPPISAPSPTDRVTRPLTPKSFSQYLDVPLDRIKVVQATPIAFPPAMARAVRVRFRSAL